MSAQLMVMMEMARMCELDLRESGFRLTEKNKRISVFDDALDRAGCLSGGHRRF